MSETSSRRCVRRLHQHRPGLHGLRRRRRAPAHLRALLSDLVPAVQSLKVGDTFNPETEMGPLISDAHRTGHRLRATRGRTMAGRHSSPAVSRCPAAIAGSSTAHRHHRRRPEGRDNPKRSVRTGHNPAALLLTRSRPLPGRTTSTTASPPQSGAATPGARCALARKLQFGTVWINTHFVITPEMPHGGYKQSGYGKDMSIYSLEDYTADQARDGGSRAGGVRERATDRPAGRLTQPGTGR